MRRRPDLVIALTYYAPYVSGLSITAQDVAEGLAARGWRVVVVTSRHDANLSSREDMNGVEVVRCRPLLSVTKGVVCPTFVPTAVRLLRQARVGHLHLPLLEGGVIAAAVRRSTPLLSTYHCDVVLPPSPLNRAALRLVQASDRAAVRRSATVVISSLDYARSSRVWPELQKRNLVEISPPCRDRSGGSPAFRQGSGPHIGFLGRVVGEKGLEHLIEAFRLLHDPEARLLIGGDFVGVAGGSVIDRLTTRTAEDSRIAFLGFVPEHQLADFYASLDCFVLPSVNSLEAFGIVQVEAMSAGVPVAASDRPGVRVPVAETGCGLLFPEAEPEAMRSCLEQILRASKEDMVDPGKALKLFGRDATVDRYEEALGRLRER